jgi:hypothetical protein
MSEGSPIFPEGASVLFAKILQASRIGLVFFFVWLVYAWFQWGRRFFDGLVESRAAARVPKPGPRSANRRPQRIDDDE